MGFLSSAFNRLNAYLVPHNWRRHYRQPYDFTKDYFTSRIPLWRRTLAHLRGRAELRALEVGTYEGRSALWLLENILTDPSSRLVCVDLFYELPDAESRFHFNLGLSGA